MKITFVGQHGSVSDITWENVPLFAVLTGVNGAGKSQLLEVIANTYHALRPVNPRDPGIMQEIRSGMPPPQAVIEGAKFESGEVFHSYSEWQLSGGGHATFEQISEAFNQIGNSWNIKDDPPWIIKKIAERAQIPPEEVKIIPKVQLEEIVTPYMLWGESFPLSPRSLSFLFLTYSIFESNAIGRGKTPAEVRSLYGERPWNVLNEIINAASLPYRVIEPEERRSHSIFAKESYSLKLHDVERGCEVPFDKLSSGERIIMSTAIWNFGLQEVGRHYKLLLLDEPDAHLHPSMTRRFLEVIQKIFVEERGVRVIMTTHSPSTVALVPESSLFEMRRDAPRIQKVANRASVIADLTDGFVVVHEGMRVVFCEGEHDQPFYEEVWNRLSDPISMPEKLLLPRTPPLVFMHGKGIDTIRNIVPQLRASGLSHFHGLIDLDDGNKAEDGIHVIDRYALENYLFDPISIWYLLHNEDIHPKVEGINIPLGQRSRVRQLSQDELQRVADAVLELVLPNLDNLNAEEKNLRTILFVNGLHLSYPKWFLHRNKEELKGAFKQAFPRLKKDSYNELITSFVSLDMIPHALYELMRSIQLST